MTAKPPPRHVFRWDLDKTYLRTEFDSFRDLIKSAIETAADKKAYPGAASLLRALRAGDGHRICIVSGSPSQMKTVLAAKLRRLATRLTGALSQASPTASSKRLLNGALLGTCGTRSTLTPQSGHRTRCTSITTVAVNALQGRSRTSRSLKS